jgi:DNA-binding transcriptional ArsR family regulator
MKLDQAVMVSSYNQNLSAIPRPHLAWDGVSFLHVAWTETDRGGDERVASSVTYGKMNLQNNSFTHLRIAEFDEPLKDATVAPGPDGSAYVVWQFQNASSDHGSIFVSQISKSCRIAFSKQIKHPDLMDSVSPYLAISADSKDNLYVVWYQTPRAPLDERFQSTSRLTSVSYVKLDYEGSIEETKSELVQGRVFAVTVSGSGDMYAISQQGIVRLAKPNRGFAFELIVIGAVTITAFAGATATEEGRYRFASCVILAGRSRRKDGIEDGQEEAILKFIYRRPGCRLRDLRHLSRSRKLLALKLARLESAGYLASTREGWARRFYVHPEIESRATSEGHPPLTIASRVLIEVARNPGIWESKLAATLGLSQQIVHYHMKKLRAANLIISEQDGKRKLHRLARTELSRREGCADIV